MVGLLLGAALAFAAPALAQEDEGDDVEITGFSIPNTRSAAARLARAEDHIAAERWNEALADLQELIATHRGELVRVSSGRASDAPVFRGASTLAAELMLELPEAPLELYRRKFGARAAAALQLARDAGDRQALVEVTQRWPATEATVLAWWSLGDLELELGNLSEARQAWSRALAHRVGAAARLAPLRFDGDAKAAWEGAQRRLDELGGSLADGERRRLDLALATLGEENPLGETDRLRIPERGSLRLPGPGEGAHGTPGPHASTWSRPFRLPAGGPFEHGSSNLFPIRVGDTVFVSDSLQLFAIGAYSGDVLWSSGRPEGWDAVDRSRRDFFAGISRDDTMIAPAASEGIVVSAHQVPISDITNEAYRNISITTVIPDRRLFAFDAETGEELWNHAPADNWDGESGDFTERMSVAGPPVISASRVLVPVHRMYGRIEFYVACYDLVSGEVLWTTQLVSGQRELNMFARAEREFSAPPVRVERDRVVVQSQLGAIATLDLFSGSILWETLYDQISLPQRNHFNAQRIRNVWRNAPPVVADGVVVAAPFDGRHLLGIDLDSGETLWSIPNGFIDNIAGSSRANSIDVLLGADRHAVFLGSWPVLALRSSGGLSREAPRELAWRYPAGEVDSNEATSARAIVLDDRVVIPTRSERIEVDRFGGGRRHKSLPWKGQRGGNLLVENGTLYSLTTKTLDGYFEWDMLLARGRRAYDESGGDLDASLYLSRLLSERSRTELETGRTAQARDWLVEAERLLEPFLDVPDLPPGVAQEMHGLLRTRGQVYVDLADGASALVALRRARTYAPDADALRDTLIEEYRLVVDADAAAQREVLDLFDARCRASEMNAVLTELSGLPYGWRFEPLTEENASLFQTWTLPMSLWTTLERAQLAADEEVPADEFSELQRLLEVWPDEPVPRGGAVNETVADLARRRVEELIRRHGRYAPYERQASELLAEARETHDRDLLELVPELYPYSEAGRDANDDLLLWASEQGDAAAVAEIVLSELPESWAPGEATPRQLDLLLHLGAALETSGNRRYPRGLYRVLAGRHPNVVSPAPAHSGKTLAALASTDVAMEPAEANPPTFGPEAETLLQRSGSHVFLGPIPPSTGEAAEPVYLYVRESGTRGRDLSLVAYAESALTGADAGPLWEQELEPGDMPASWTDAIVFVPGAVVAMSGDSVYALDREDGSRFWSRDWRPEQGEVDSLRSGDGLVLVTVRVPGKYDALYALDWSGGQQVWQTDLDALRYGRQPIVGADRVVLMPRRSQQRGRVLDLYSGRPVVDFELPVRIHQSAHRAAWIAGDLLVVPWFLTGRNEDRNRILAMDLRTGDLAWNVDFGQVAGGRRQLRTVAQWDDKTYLVLQPVVGAETEDVRGIFVELDLRIGATRRVGSFELAHDHRFVGLAQERRVALVSPTIYLHRFMSEAGDLRLEALDLRYGNVRWTQQLDLTRDELYNALTRLPAESEDTVALVFSTKGNTRFGRAHSNLFLLDRNTGRTERRVLLDARLGASNEIDLRGIGSALILAGDGAIEVLR